MFLDELLTFTHIIVIFFNVIAPFIPHLRAVSIGVQGLTFLSWIGLGLFYGIGYCPLTDVHWNIKRELGESNLPASFIKYQLDLIFSADLDPFFLDVLTVGCFAAAVLFNIYSSIQTKG